MGQKVHPLGFRLGVTETWNSRWYRKTGYAEQLKQDFATIVRAQSQPISQPQE